MTEVAPLLYKLAVAEPVTPFARLFQMRQFLSTVVPVLLLHSPPPLVEAELPEKVQFVSTEEEAELNTPAPLLDEFPENRQLVTVGELAVLFIPPPLLEAVLPEKMQLLTVVGELALCIPAPLVVQLFRETVQLPTVVEAALQ